MWILRKIKILFFVGVCGLVPTAWAGTVTVTSGTTYQTISGFGAASVWVEGKVTAALATQFWKDDSSLPPASQVNGNVGLSILRIYISELGATSDFTTAINSAKQAIGVNPNMVVFGSCWSPPSSMKTGGHSVNGDGTGNDNFNTSGKANTMNTADLPQYATYLTSFATSCKSAGVSLAAISPANEPDYDPTYQSCLWTPQQFDTLIGSDLGPDLTAAGFTNTMIMTPESFADNLTGSNTTMADATAAKYVKMIGMHLYGGGPNTIPTSYSTVAGHNVESWETETSEKTSDGLIDSGIYYAGQLHNCIVDHNFNAYCYWWLINLNTDDEGLCDNTSTPTKRLYTIGNYSKFIRPGFVRIGATEVPSAGVSVSAYYSSSTGKVVIVAINSNSSTQSETFNYSDLSVSTVYPWITSSSLNLVQQSSVPVSGGNFTFTLPSQSVVSFVAAVSSSGSNTATPTSTPTRTNTPMNTPSSTPTRTATFSPTDTATATPTNSSTNTATLTATKTASSTATNTVANTATATPSASSTATRTNTATTTFTATNTVTPTATRTNAFTSTSSATPTNTMANTLTSTPSNTATGTATVTRTNTTTATASNTASRTTTTTPTNTLAETATPTATSSLTSTLVNTATNTTTATASNTASRTTTATPTNTLANTATSTPTSTLVNTATNTTTATASSTASRTTTATATNTLADTATQTATFTPTSTLMNTATNTSTTTASSTASKTTTATATNTLADTATQTATFTPTSTLVNTATNTTTATAFDTATKTTTATPTDTLADTATQTATSTATSTLADTATQTATSTPTNTLMNTATHTTTPTDTSTATSTVTVTTTPTEVTVIASQGLNPPGPSTQIPGASSVTIQQVQLTNPGNTVVTLSSLTLSETTTSTTGITSASLLDNGVVISNANFNGGPTATFNLTSSNTIPANGGSVTYQVVVNFSTSAVIGSYPFSVTGAVGNNGQPVGFSPLPVIGATVAIASATSTPTNSSTATASNTVTKTATSTPTNTFTNTATQTATSTPTNTLTSTPSRTATPTNTPTPTNTLTKTTTPTPTATPTNTLVSTSTPTATPTSNKGVVIYPNPVTGPTVNVLPPAYSGVADVQVEIFTIAFREVQNEFFRSVPSGTAVKVELTDRRGTSLADGIYYVVVIVDGHRSIGKLLIIR